MAVNDERNADLPSYVGEMLSRGEGLHFIYTS